MTRADLFRLAVARQVHVRPLDFAPDDRERDALTAAFRTLDRLRAHIAAGHRETDRARPAQFSAACAEATAAEACFEEAAAALEVIADTGLKLSVRELPSAAQGGDAVIMVARLPQWRAAPVTRRMA